MYMCTYMYMYMYIVHVYECFLQRVVTGGLPPFNVKLKLFYNIN